MLAALERLHAPATFFEVGIEERYFYASTSAIVARGYPIGDHTESHAPMSQLSMRDQQAQLLQDTAAIGDYGAPFPRLYRPPYGLWNHDDPEAAAPLPDADGPVDRRHLDYRSPGVATIVQRARRRAPGPGAIILMHDAGGNRTETVAALPIIIRDPRRRGYKLVTVPRLLLDNPAPAHQPVASLQGAGG